MRHIEVVRYGEAPCGGELRRRPITPAAVPAPARHRSLPLLGAPAAPAEPDEEWVCEGCGRTWRTEPRLDEAL